MLQRDVLCDAFADCASGNVANKQWQRILAFEINVSIPYALAHSPSGRALSPLYQKTFNTSQVSNI